MKTIEERFWNNINKTDTCWLWTGSIRGKCGYGEIYDGKNNLSVHRYSWILHNGEIPEGMCILHKCDVRYCCRPDHLFLGTNKDNSSDMVLKGRQAKGERSGKYTHPEKTARGERHGSKTKPEKILKGEKNGMSKLTELDIPKIRKFIIDGLHCTDIAKNFNVSKSIIYHIKHNRNWKHIS